MDGSKAAILLSNYQGCGGSTAYDLTLNVNNLHSIFSGKNVNYSLYRVDETHGNTYFSASQTEPAVIDSGGKSPDSNQTFNITLPPNSVSLLVLTPGNGGETWTQIDDTNGAISYSGTWTTESNASDYNGGIKLNGTPGDYAVYFQRYGSKG